MSLEFRVVEGGYVKRGVKNFPSCDLKGSKYNPTRFMGAGMYPCKGKTDSKCCPLTNRIINVKLNGSCYLAGTKATGANCYSLNCAVNISLNFSDVGLPHSVGLTIRVGNVLTECNALAAY